MAEETKEVVAEVAQPEAAAPVAEVVVPTPTEFCEHFLQQLEGGTVLVPVTATDEEAFTVVAFGAKRFKISVALVKRLRKAKKEVAE